MLLNYYSKWTGWPKSNVQKVRGYCSASDHRIRKICSGVCKDSHWFEEYLKIIFSNERSFFAFFPLLTCLDHISFGLLFFGPSRYKFTVKIRALACPILEICRVIDCVHHSLPGFNDWIFWQDRMQQGAADRSNRVINSANEVSDPVKWDHMLAKGGLGVHYPTSWTRFVLVFISNTGHARALTFTVNL